MLKLIIYIYIRASKGNHTTSQKLALTSGHNKVEREKKREEERERERERAGEGRERERERERRQERGERGGVREREGGGRWLYEILSLNHENSNIKITTASFSF